MPNGIPVIGEIVTSPHDKYSENGVDIYDQLLCDESSVLESLHPMLYSKDYIYNGIGDSLYSKARDEIRSIFKTDSGYILGITGSPQTAIYTDNNFIEISSEVYSISSSNMQGLVEFGGFLWAVVGFNQNTLYKINTDGSVLESLSLGSGNKLDLAIKDGMFYIPDLTNGTITEVDPVSMTISDTITPTLPSGSGNKIGSILWYNDVWYCYIGGYGMMIYDDNFSIVSTYFTSDSVGVAISYDTSGNIIFSDGVTINLTGKVTPKITSQDPLTPYRIVADLTEDE